MTGGQTREQAGVHVGLNMLYGERGSSLRVCLVNSWFDIGNLEDLYKKVHIGLDYLFFNFYFRGWDGDIQPKINNQRSLKENSDFLVPQYFLKETFGYDII